MSKIEFTMRCCLCDQELSVEHDLPAGWCGGYGDVSVEEDHCFCPEHSKCAEFFDAQCCGCVAGRGECEFAQKINAKAVPLSDLMTIRLGKCPYRTNGSFMMSARGFEPLTLSDVATAESANALADAILGAKP